MLTAGLAALGPPCWLLYSDPVGPARCGYVSEVAVRPEAASPRHSVCFRKRVTCPLRLDFSFGSFSRFQAAAGPASCQAGAVGRSPSGQLGRLRHGTLWWDLALGRMWVVQGARREGCLAPTAGPAWRSYRAFPRCAGRGCAIWDPLQCHSVVSVEHFIKAGGMGCVGGPLGPPLGRLGEQKQHFLPCKMRWAPEGSRPLSGAWGRCS